MSAQTATVSDVQGNPWKASFWAGLVTAIIAVVTVLAFQAEIPVAYGIAFLLIGAGPVIGYQIATGRPFSSIGSIIGGIVGFILPILGWPILVRCADKGAEYRQIAARQYRRRCAGHHHFLGIGHSNGAKSVLDRHRLYVFSCDLGWNRRCCDGCLRYCTSK